MEPIDTIIHGDCLDEMAKMLPESVHSIVTDPPYGLGFMGKNWDHGIPGPAFWKEALTVAKPGAFLLAFGGTRTFHRLTCAIEDAGWEIRDCIMWVYGSGFPKSLDISKAIDKAAGADRKVIGSRGYTSPDIRGNSSNGRGISGPENEDRERLSVPITEPFTTPAKVWQGWGTSLKPAWEPIIVAMKPCDGTFAENAQKHGVAGLNIDASRIPVGDEVVALRAPNTARPDLRDGVVGKDLGISKSSPEKYQASQNESLEKTNSMGRFPANIIHDGSDEVLECFPQSDGQCGALQGGESSKGQIYGQFGPKSASEPRNDFGSAARFFYCAKAGRSERDEGLGQMVDGKPVRWNKGGVWTDDTTPAKNIHPTVKPLALMRYLVKLVCPPNGIVLDPFCGSGSTCLAAQKSGFHYVGIEKEKEYVEIARARLVQPQATLI